MLRVRRTVRVGRSGVPGLNKIRLRYSKTGKAVYISHLDLMTLFARALLRAGVRLGYSEGFNPHPYISIALPLPVGCASVCELADFGTEVMLLPDGLPELINNVLPEGITVLEAYTSRRGFNDIAWVGLHGALHYDAGAPPNTVSRLTERFSAGSLVITKKTKRGTSDIDIIPYVRDIMFTGRGDNELSPQQDCGVSPAEILLDFSPQRGAESNRKFIDIDIKVSAQNPSINAENILSAVRGGGSLPDNNDSCEVGGLAIPDFSRFTRMEVYGSNMEVFR